MLFLKKRCLTLIELLLVFGLLAVLGAAAGINVAHAVKQQRFKTEVSAVVDALRFSQNLMLILEQDVFVRMRGLPSQQGIEVAVEIEGSIPKEWQPIVEKFRTVLKETHYVSLDPPEGVGELTLRFQSGGSLMTQGVLRLSTAEDPRTAGAITEAVCLKGYPHPILSFPDTGQAIDCRSASDQDFATRLTRLTMQELTEDVQQ